MASAKGFLMGRAGVAGGGGAAAGTARGRAEKTASSVPALARGEGAGGDAQKAAAEASGHRGAAKGVDKKTMMVKDKDSMPRASRSRKQTTEQQPQEARHNQEDRAHEEQDHHTLLHGHGVVAEGGSAGALLRGGSVGSSVVSASTLNPKNATRSAPGRRTEEEDVALTEAQMALDRAHSQPAPAGTDTNSSSPLLRAPTEPGSTRKKGKAAKVGANDISSISVTQQKPSSSVTKQKSSKHGGKVKDRQMYGASFRNGAPADLSGWWNVKSTRELGIGNGTKNFCVLKGCMLTRYSDDSMNDENQLGAYCLYGCEIRFDLQEGSIQFMRLRLRMLTTNLKQFVTWARTIKEVSLRRIEDCYLLQDIMYATDQWSVRLGMERVSGQQVSIKVIRRLLISPVELKRLENEVSILMMLDHPGILPTYDLFDDEESFYIVFKLCTGGTLAEALAERGRFSEHETLEILRSVLTAVASVHRQGIVHRDIQPRNIVLGSRAWPLEPRLAEFGLSARVADPPGAMSGSTQINESEPFAGTWAYLAPEVICKKGTTVAADMWSVGVMMYQLLSGSLPFAGESVLDCLAAIVETEPNYDLPQFFGKSTECMLLLRALLCKDPLMRITAEEALQNRWVNPCGVEDRWLVDGMQGLQESLSLVQRLLVSTQKRGQNKTPLLLKYRASRSTSGKAGGRDVDADATDDFIPLVAPALSFESMSSLTRSSELSGWAAESSAAAAGAGGQSSSDAFVFGRSIRRGEESQRINGGGPSFARGPDARQILYGETGPDGRSTGQTRKGILTTLGEKGGEARAAVFLTQ
ncbi:Myosin light chain kinase A [Porphyridium purpureum]|uniref:Myosin light chain kinase A n=1 Tax=Porphyridium purpureum TaxID=35688 RepID=A0A5J4YP22_PORPP|nr:Myosin light chain kinase A [Porphyridium purpureum]|eukprot:POR3324..scf296_7